MHFLFHEETHKLLPSYASLATMWAPLPSYCVAPASDCVPLCPVFSFFVTAFRPFYPRVSVIDRSQATDFASAFHLCPVLLTRPFTCRPTRCVKSAQILETAFESKPWQHGVQFSSLENVQHWIQVKKKKKLSIVYNSKWVFLPSLLLWFFWAACSSCLSPSHNPALLYITAADWLWVPMKCRDRLKMLSAEGWKDGWLIVLKWNFNNTNSIFNVWVYVCH